MVLANNLEGYDNIVPNVNFDVTYTPITQSPLITTVTSAPNRITFSGTIVSGDIIRYSYVASGGAGVVRDFAVTDRHVGNLSALVTDLAGYMTSQGGVTGVPGPAVPAGGPYSFITYSYSGGATLFTMWVINSAQTNVAYKSFKLNSRYQFGIVYYDEFNRSSTVQTGPEFVVKTESFADIGASIGNVNNGVRQPVINWSINHEAPSWAKKYQWVRTNNLTANNGLFLMCNKITNPLNQNYLELDISSLLDFQKDNPSSLLSYDFSKYDRCTIGSIDVPVLGVEVVSETVLTLRIAKPIQGSYSPVPTVVNNLIEIYTTTPGTVSPTDLFFYEFGEQYDCENGVHSETSGSFTDGDWYIRSRPLYTQNLTPGSTVKRPVMYVIQDKNYSDFYVSDFNSQGRTNIYAPQAKQLHLPTDIRYSETYVPNVNVNGLSRFYGTSFEAYDRINGSIQKLAVRDNYLFTFQELKTGYIPINQSIIEDQGSGNPNVAISTKLLNKIRYLVGDYGIGTHPESFARFAGKMFFLDTNRNKVLRLSSGIDEIGAIGMDKYFTKKISQFNQIENSKMIGMYDPYNDEYIVTFREGYSGGDFDESIAWSMTNNRWTTFYDFIPDFSVYVYDKFFTYRFGTLYEHNINEDMNSFYTDQFVSTITAVFNGSPYQVKTFIGLMQQSTSPWVPERIDTSNGQRSSLVDDDFSFRENIYMSSFLRDEDSDGGIINGDVLKGNWIKLEMVNGSRDPEIMQSCNVRAIPSYQGLK